MTPGSRIAPVPPPLLTSKSPSEPMIHVRCPPSAWVEVPSDSDDEAVACVQPLTYGHNSPRPVGNPAGLTAKLTAEVNVLRDLPPLLTHITLEESALSPDGKCLSASISRKDSRTIDLDFRLFKDAILADPFYLGEPRHIRLRNSKGSVTKRVMSTPTPGAPTPERWYAVACGTEVGIFLSWLGSSIYSIAKTNWITGSLLGTSLQGRRVTYISRSTLNRMRTSGSRWPSSEGPSSYSIECRLFLTYCPLTSYYFVATTTTL